MIRTFGKVAMQTERALSFGFDPGAKGWQEVVLDRWEGSPLAFVGCQICSHWRRFGADKVLRITLWRRKKRGFAIAYSLWAEGALRDDSVAVDSVAEAITFLEDYCALPPAQSKLSGPLLDALQHIHAALSFHQGFSFLVGEALAAWADLDVDSGQGAGQRGITA